MKQEANSKCTSLCKFCVTAFIITYDEIGYVSDADADKINYDELLTEMKNDLAETIQERTEAGYGTVSLIGWAAKPYYDKEKRVLHWAKEMNFDQSETNTLNYNVRVLGRKGVMVLNAVGDMAQLTDINAQIDKVLPSVSYNDGFKYADFDSSVDKVAAVTLGGLVAGKILAKAGILALLLKNIKLIGLAVIAFFSFIWRWITGRKKEEESLVIQETIQETPPTNPS